MRFVMIDVSLLAGGDLCVVGNINRDIKTAAIWPGAYLFEDGETSTSTITETIGGGGAISACTAAALGARSGFLGKVGDDPLGQRLGQVLRHRGVDTHLVLDPEVSTGTTVNLNYETGHRHFISALPNNRELRASELDLSMLGRFNHLLRADIWFSEPMLFGGNAELFEAASAAGMSISIDLNWDPAWARGMDENTQKRKRTVRDLLPLVTLAHGNSRELCLFTDAPDLDSALQRLQEWGVGSVVVHLGREGAGYYCEGQLTIEPPAPVLRPVQLTGTGDVLSVCMMLLHPHPDIAVRDRLRLANQIVAEFMEGKREFISNL